MDAKKPLMGKPCSRVLRNVWQHFPAGAFAHGEIRSEFACRTDRGSVRQAKQKLLSQHQIGLGQHAGCLGNEHAVVGQRNALLARAGNA